MIKLTANLFSLSVLLSSVLTADTLDIQQGWQMLGSSHELTGRNLDIFGKACVDRVWMYDQSNGWQQRDHGENVQEFDDLAANQGFWVKAVVDCSLESQTKGIFGQNETNILIGDDEDPSSAVFTISLHNNISTDGSIWVLDGYDEMILNHESEWQESIGDGEAMGLGEEEILNIVGLGQTDYWKFQIRDDLDLSSIDFNRDDVVIFRYTGASDDGETLSFNLRTLQDTSELLTHSKDMGGSFYIVQPLERITLAYRASEEPTLSYDSDFLKIVSSRSQESDYYYNQIEYAWVFEIQEDIDSQIAHIDINASLEISGTTTGSRVYLVFNQEAIQTQFVDPFWLESAKELMNHNDACDYCANLGGVLPSSQDLEHLGKLLESSEVNGTFWSNEPYYDCSTYSGCSSQYVIYSFDGSYSGGSQAESLRNVWCMRDQ